MDKIPLRWCKSRAVRVLPALLMSLPVLCAAGPPRDFVFVTAQDSYADRGDVAMVDSSSGRVVTWIPVGDAPLKLVLTPNGDRGFVPNNSSRSVSVVDLTTLKVTATIDLAAGPTGVAFSVDGSEAYVSTVGDGPTDVVEVIDTATYQVVDSIPVGRTPNMVAVRPDGAIAVVPNGFSRTLSVIDLASRQVSEIALEVSPTMVAFTPDSRFGFVSIDSHEEGRPHELLVFDQDLQFRTLDLGTPVRPEGGIAFSADSRTAYVGVTTDEEGAGAGLIEIDVESLQITRRQGFETGAGATGTALSLDGSRVYVAGWTEFFGQIFGHLWEVRVSDLEVESVVEFGSMETGGVTAALASPPAPRLAVVTMQARSTVALIDADALQIRTEIAVGTDPDGVAISPDGSVAYVANGGSANVSVIDLVTYAVTAIPLGSAPRRVAFTPNGSAVYVTSALNVFVIDPATRSPVATIPFTASSQALAIAATPDGSRAYVTTFHPASGIADVAVIDTATNTITQTISSVCSYQALSLAFTRDGALAYVACDSESPSEVAVIDTDPTSSTYNSVVNRVSFGPNRSTGVATSADGAYVYVTHRTGTVSVISRNGGLLQTLTLGVSPYALAVKGTGDLVLVADGGIPASLYAVETMTGRVAATLPLPGYSFGVAVE